MINLESIRELIIDYLEDASRHTDEEQKLLLILGNEKLYFKVQGAFFNFVSSPTLSPERIVHLLGTYTSGLEGFSTNKSIQAVVAFACFGGLVRRRPNVLFGPWETLLWIIVKFTSLTNTSLISALMDSRIGLIGLGDKDIPNWITKFTSQELCPNPCLRLELFKFIRAFRRNRFIKDRKSFCDNVINTVLELSDNNTSLTVDKVPNFGPVDLLAVMEDNDINMGFIINSYDLDLQKTKIIAAMLKLTNNFALLVEEKYRRFNNDELRIHVSFEHQMAACFSFCGLISEFELEHDDCMLYLVKAVCKDYFLLNYVVDTLDIITKVSLSFPYKDDIFTDRKEKLLHRLFKGVSEGYVNRFPKFQYLQEIHGGISPAAMCCLRYLQNNSVDQYNDSEYDSECYASNENDDRLNTSEENDSAMDLSDEDTSGSDDLFNE